MRERPPDVIIDKQKARRVQCHHFDELELHVDETSMRERTRVREEA